ncbi:hypothetical protein EJB05_43579, partial [Eragrostis curvula]
MAAEEALQPGQLYFVLPASMLRRPLSGQDMAAHQGAGRRGRSCHRRRRRVVAAKGRRRASNEAGLNLGVGRGPPGSPLRLATAHKTGYDGERTVGKTRHRVGRRSGARGRRAGVQRLSAIAEGAE